MYAYEEVYIWPTLPSDWNIAILDSSHRNLASHTESTIAQSDYQKYNASIHSAV